MGVNLSHQERILDETKSRPRQRTFTAYVYVYVNSAFEMTGNSKYFVARRTSN